MIKPMALPWYGASAAETFSTPTWSHSTLVPNNHKKSKRILKQDLKIKI